MYLTEELEKLFKTKDIKNIIIFGSGLWNQTEATIYSVRNYTGANIHIFFRDEDINNLNLEGLSNFPGIRYNSYRLDISSLSRIKRAKPQLAIILCDNPYNIGYRKAKLFSLICGADTVIFNNILNEVRWFNLQGIWKSRRKLMKNLLIAFIDSIAAVLFYFTFVFGVKLIYKFKRLKP